MKTAMLYLRKGIVYIQPHSQTVDGAWIGTPPLAFVEIEDVERLGLLTISALERSEVGVPHPTDFRGLVSPLLSKAGVKTWAQFVRGTRALMVETADTKLRLTPYMNRGATDGFDGILTAMRDHISTGDPARLGNWIIEAFEDCS
jgi:hypothetical protein